MPSGWSDSLTSKTVSYVQRRSYWSDSDTFQFKKEKIILLLMPWKAELIKNSQTTELPQQEYDYFNQQQHVHDSGFLFSLWGYVVNILLPTLRKMKSLEHRKQPYPFCDRWSPMWLGLCWACALRLCSVITLVWFQMHKSQSDATQV